MGRWVFKHKNKLTLTSGILIVLGILNHLFFKIPNLTTWTFIVASLIGAAPIAIGAYQSLKVKVVSIDVLVTVAIIGAFLIKNYEESAVVSFLFLFGGYLEQRTLNKTRSAIKALAEIAPDSALKLTESGDYEKVDIDEVDIGDILLVKTGDKIPVDGSVMTGSAYVNEASITGESDFVKKEEHSPVFAGTILENGTMTIVAEKLGEDTTFGKIIELVEEAQDSKSEAERFIDSFSKYYTPMTLVLALIVFIFSKNIELAITVLVLGCPGALVIGVPVSNVAGIGNGAKNGVLLKGSELIKSFSKTDTFIFDKTGTLTLGKAQVKEAKFFRENEDYIKDILVSIEKESDHPLAQALVEEYGTKRQIYPVTDTHVVKGGGIKAQVDNKKVLVGNLKLLENNDIKIKEDQRKLAEDFEKSGSSITALAIDGDFVALFGIRDKLRPDAKEKLQELKKLGAKNLIILSGDNQGSVDIIKEELGLTEAYGNLLPQDKADFVKKLKKEGRTVSFIGDGINDSPSLALADVGIAMGSGTDVAIEVSDLVLMNSDISKLPHAYGLAKKTYKNMIENIVIAVGVVIFLLASLIFSDRMNMSIGMLVHEGSILAVILNGMRLINYKLK
jgi:Cd2+/Zn2+-exporting ATPase